jgi:phosphonate transport system ATP-binding protein
LADRKAFQALFGIFTKEQKEYARKQLEAVGLSEKMYSYAGKLSGGQKQRVAIARALMQKPDIILADEPVASLDPYSAEQITDILVKLNRQYNITVIMNSHSVELALKKSDRIIGIADGRLVLDKKSSEVTDENIEFIYGGAYEKHE